MVVVVVVVVSSCSGCSVVSRGTSSNGHAGNDIGIQTDLVAHRTVGQGFDEPDFDELIFIKDCRENPGRKALHAQPIVVGKLSDFGCVAVGVKSAVAASTENEITTVAADMADVGMSSRPRPLLFRHCCFCVCWLFFRVRSCSLFRHLMLPQTALEETASRQDPAALQAFDAVDARSAIQLARASGTRPAATLFCVVELWLLMLRRNDHLGFRLAPGLFAGWVMLRDLG